VLDSLRAMAPFLPYGRHSVNEADIEAVVRALQSDWLTQGAAVEEFETAICRAVGSAHAVACNSGTAALHLAALAAGLKSGDATVVPAITFLSTANAVRMTGADVVFADVDPGTGRMNAETFAAAVERADHAIKAVLPVHLAGAVSEPEAIAKVASSAGAVVIEDACHALGGSYGRGDGEASAIGSCADAQMACFSFHPVKPITTGEGGAVTTNDADLAQRLRLFRNHGMTRDAGAFQNAALARAADGTVNPWYYEMPALGWNYRIPDLLCALGISQLKRLPEYHARRQALVRLYRERLASLVPAVRPLAEQPGTVSGHHLFVVLIDFAGLKCERAHVMGALRERGIGTQVHYIPVPWQPYYRERYGQGHYPGAAEYYRRCLTLPLFPAMNGADVDCVVTALVETLGLA
jgi:UDP-4-amino-4,6-dideoxy-N-acetyl-beta-L-altrosamine transaminase